MSTYTSSSSSSDKPDSPVHRLRLIVSCDYCRHRKIRCKTQLGESSCDSCVKRQRECTYDARTNYYATRERRAFKRITGSISDSVNTSGGPSAGPSMTTIVPGLQRAFTPASHGSVQESTPAPSSAYQVLPSTSMPADSDFPPICWMPHFVELFFAHRGADFPFLSHADVVADFLNCTLSALLANVIAALAAPYSGTMPVLSAIDPIIASEEYALRARNLLPGYTAPSIDTLASLVLISNFELDAQRIDNARWYAQEAAITAAALGLQDDSTLVAISRNNTELQRLVSLRDAVFQLQFSDPDSSPLWLGDV